MAAIVGVRRKIHSLGSKDTNHVGNKKFGWQEDIEGACAELAVGKAFNIFWNGSVNTYKAPDLSGRLQVRYTELDHGSLIFRGNDNVNDNFILVTGLAPNYIIRGWLKGCDAKQDEYIKYPDDKIPSWFVPQNKLLPIGQLISILNN